jgi:hypothetical protein
MGDAVDANNADMGDDEDDDGQSKTLNPDYVDYSDCFSTSPSGTFPQTLNPKP